MINKKLLLAVSLFFPYVIAANPIHDVLKDIFTYGPNDCKGWLKALIEVKEKDYKDKDEQFVKDVNEADKNGCTPLYYGVRTHCIEMVKFLLANGAIASINKSSKVGLTPLRQAFNINNSENEWEMIKLLLIKGAILSLNKTDKNGDTLLSVILLNPLQPIDGARLKTIKLLLYLGAQIVFKDITDGLKKNAANIDDLEMLLEHNNFSEEEKNKKMEQVRKDHKILKDLFDDPKKVYQKVIQNPTSEELKEFKEIQNTGSKVFEKEPDMTYRNEDIINFIYKN